MLVTASLIFTSSVYAGDRKKTKKPKPTPTRTECRVDDPTPSPTVTPEPENTPTPEPESTPTPEPTKTNTKSEQTWFGFFGYSTTQTPECADGSPILLPTNPHVYRKDDVAIVKWVPTQGDKVHIYYRVNGSQVWEHSLADQTNNGYAVIERLDASLGYTFAIQQAQGCAGGDTVLAIIIDPPARKWTLFTNPTWQWSH